MSYNEEELDQLVSDLKKGVASPDGKHLSAAEADRLVHEIYHYKADPTFNPDLDDVEHELPRFGYE